MRNGIVQRFAVGRDTVGAVVLALVDDRDHSGRGLLVELAGEAVGPVAGAVRRLRNAEWADQLLGDDVDQLVEDYFIDFYVATRDGRAHAELTLFFDEEFEGRVTRHSASPSHQLAPSSLAEAVCVSGSRLIERPNVVSSGKSVAL